MYTQSVQPYKVTIELDAFMDWMSMLRGMTIDNRFYSGLTSDELPRFPSFTGGQWTSVLPGQPGFEEFLHRAITGENNKKKKLFDKVRPYDFAQQNIEYLHRNNTQITIRCHDLFDPYIEQVASWVQNTLPGDSQSMRINVVDSKTQIHDQDIWVARNPNTITTLVQQGQPHIVLDGIENSDIDNVVRMLRWDQIGFLLRHGLKIDSLRKYAHSDAINFGHNVEPIFPPHKDIWQGNPYVILPIDATQHFLGKQRRSLELVLEKPHKRLQSIHKNQPLTQEVLLRQQNAFDAISFDLNEIDRKAVVLEQIIFDLNKKKIRHFDWVEIIRTRNQDMQKQLDHICDELMINKSSGNTTSNPKSVKPRKFEDFDKRKSHSDELTERILNNDTNKPLLLYLSGSETIHLLSKNWDLLRNNRLGHDPSSIAGQLAEMATAFLLEENGWKLLSSDQNANNNNQGAFQFLWHFPGMFDRNKQKSTSNRFNRIQVQWNDMSTGELRNAEVDLLARKYIKDPATNKRKPVYIIAEVKLSDITELSELQKELRDHINRGGRIINPGYPGIRSKTFAPAWREIRIDDGLVRRVQSKVETGLSRGL